MNLNKCLEKNLEVVWENERHTSSAGLAYNKFTLVKVIVSKIAYETL